MPLAYAYPSDQPFGILTVWALMTTAGSSIRNIDNCKNFLAIALLTLFTLFIYSAFGLVDLRFTTLRQWSAHKLFADFIIHSHEAIGLAVALKNLFPGIERLPDAGTFAAAVRYLETNVVHFFFFMRVLHYNHISIVLFGEISRIVFQVFQRAMPFRIVRKPDHVKGNLPRYHIVIEQPAFVVLSAECYMQHNGCSRRHNANTIDAGIYQLRQAIKISNVAFRPDHAVIDLVAHLYH